MAGVGRSHHGRALRPREYFQMTKCDVGQRLRQRAGWRIIEAVGMYDDGREHDWIFIDTGELAGRHRLAAMLIGWYPI